MEAWDQVLKEILAVLQACSVFENVHLTCENSTTKANKKTLL